VARRQHLGTGLFGGADIGHILGQREDVVQVVGIDDCGDSTPAARDVNRFVLCPCSVDNRGG